MYMVRYNVQSLINGTIIKINIKSNPLTLSQGFKGDPI
jgi:hypothetical protein